MRKTRGRAVVGMLAALALSASLLAGAAACRRRWQCSWGRRRPGSGSCGGGSACGDICGGDGGAGGRRHSGGEREPEIVVKYDRDGNVTELASRNEEGRQILESMSGYEGKSCREVVSQLVTAIGEAGYFVEDVDGSRRQITIEIEAGSALPYDAFLDDVVDGVRRCVDSHHWASPIDLQGETDYGMTDYVDTDYGPNNDGVTDYDDTDYGPNNDGVTDYDDTDYGPNNDGVTDYDDTDYGPNNDGVTDYDDTDYGPNSDGVTDYDDTDYGPNNDGVTELLLHRLRRRGDGL